MHAECLTDDHLLLFKMLPYSKEVGDHIMTPELHTMTNLNFNQEGEENTKDFSHITNSPKKNTHVTQRD